MFAFVIDLFTTTNITLGIYLNNNIFIFYTWTCLLYKINFLKTKNKWICHEWIAFNAEMVFLVWKYKLVSIRLGSFFDIKGIFEIYIYIYIYCSWYWDSREVSPCLFSSLRYYITTVFIYGIAVVMITFVWDSLMHHFDRVVNVHCMYDWIWLHFFYCGILLFWCKLLLLYVTSILINMWENFVRSNIRWLILHGSTFLKSAL